MHIKKIIVQGFKTYKNTTVIDLLSPHHNVVVGRNGSGKSNFFAAIRFVLSDAYTHMTREERKGLIHEGSGNVMSAYVEIVFENSERRFPIAKDEISIRRTIGLKKDDYSLDGKSATRSDIMNLLESAGFSRSNPYYIVPQGRITALTNSKDSERLSLLKEVSGAKVFEAKLKESMKEMSNSNFKKVRIDEALLSLDARLSDLQIESKDLKEYQSLEKDKKILEYKIYDRELNGLNTAIENNEDQYADILANSQEDINELSNREKLCQELTESINRLQTDLKVAVLEKNQAELDYNQMLTYLADKRIEVEELKSRVEFNKHEYKDRDSQIAYYTDLIRKHEEKLEELKPKLLDLQDKEAQIKAQLSDLTTRQRALYSKQSRFAKFTTKKQRDDWLKNEIDQLNDEITSKTSQINQVNLTIQSQADILSQIDNQVSQLNKVLSENNSKNQISDLKHDANDIRSQILEATDKRKFLWRDEIKYRSILDSLEHDLQTANHKVNQTMDRAQAKGLAAVKEITKRLNLSDSVHGPVAELFHVNDKYKTAVEVVAGNSLFHVVVDNDQTASIIMNELVRNNSGRVTFMPLNRLSPQETEFPSNDDYEFIPLISKIKHDKQKVGVAMNQIFGRTIVCSSLSKGAEISRNYKLNAITLDGDRANYNGILSGGFRDHKSSRIDVLKTQAKKRKEYEKVSQELIQCRQEIEQINSQLTLLNNDLQQKVNKVDQITTSAEPIMVEMSQCQNKKYNIEQELQSLKLTQQALEITIKNLTTKLEQYEEEISSTFSKSLSEDEQKTLSLLNNDIGECEKVLDDVVQELADIEAVVSSLESELNSNYRPHLRKLRDGNYTGDEHFEAYELSNIEKELDTLSSRLSQAEEKNQSADEELESLKDEIAKLEAELKKENNKQIGIVKKLEKFSKISEKCLSKKSLLQQRREEIEKKIAELGALPEEAFSTESDCDDLTSDQLLAQLNTTNKGLTKYAHINKKAMEQYNTFTRERSDLTKRKEELEKSRDSIEQLMTKLEKQKDQAIIKSFKQVSKSFHNIFGKLVPVGVGNLIMQERESTNANDSDSDDEPLNIENYVGVAISVSFNSRHDEQQRIEQLSGGQKSLCAIALILAIQECDPAPFYLFDEIDANLDTQYRTAVANMIHSLSGSAQFICTTFRPEMLQVADKFYGVMFGNKVSTVSEINREEAMLFVEGQQQR